MFAMPLFLVSHTHDLASKIDIIAWFLYCMNCLYIIIQRQSCSQARLFRRVKHSFQRHLHFINIFLYSLVYLRHMIRLFSNYTFFLFYTYVFGYPVSLNGAQIKRWIQRGLEHGTRKEGGVLIF